MLEYECMKKELATHDGELLSNKKVQQRTQQNINI